MRTHIERCFKNFITKACVECLRFPSACSKELLIIKKIFHKRKAKNKLNSKPYIDFKFKSLQVSKLKIVNHFGI